MEPKLLRKESAGKRYFQEWVLAAPALEEIPCLAPSLCLFVKDCLPLYDIYVPLGISIIHSAADYSDGQVASKKVVSADFFPSLFPVLFAFKSCMPFHF